MNFTMTYYKAPFSHLLVNWMLRILGLAQMRRQYFHQWEPRLLPSFFLQWDQSLRNWTRVLIRSPGSWQRISTPVQFFKLWSHWSKNDGSNLGSHWWKYCLRICAKPNIWNNNNVRNWTFIVLQGVIRAVDQGKGSHQQAQPLPEVRVFYLAYLQKHLFALWMGSGEAQIWRWSEWDLGTWGLGSHESGEDEA